MAAKAVHTVPAEAVAKLLDGDQEFLEPARLLSDLIEEQAMAVPSGSPYSIAQVTMHIHFWQGREIERAQGETQPKVDDLDATFAAPPAGEWNKLVVDVLAGVEQVKLLAQEKDGQSHAFEGATVGYVLASCALHNAYHWGQIVLLRRIQGFWPPAGDNSDW